MVRARSPLSRQTEDPDRIRRPISLKIFGIALGLLLLMGLVTALASYNLTQVHNEVQGLAEYYIPLSRAHGQMQIDLRQQLIHLERLILQQQFQEVNVAALKAEQEQFEVKGKDVEAAIARSQEIVTQAAASPKIRSHRILLARLDPELRDAARAHQHLQETVLKFLAEVKHGNHQAIHALHEVILSERKNFDEETENIRKEMEKLTQHSAEKARRLQQEALAINWSITLVASVFGLAFAWLFTRNLVRPVRRLLQGTKAVEQGNLSIQLTITSADEIAALTKAFNNMVVELRQKELIKDTFGKYVDPRIVTGLIEKQQFAIEGERRTMTIFFSDLEGFTALSERLTPDNVVKLLNRYFTLMSQPISQGKGIIDKYIGDAIMAFWGPPFTSETEHPTLACLAALEQVSRLDEFRRMLPDVLGLRKGLPVMNVRIGVATGDVTVGNIGSDSSKGYTVIGDTVNLAARLETANKQYGSNVLISEDTWRLAHQSIETRELDCVRVVGKTDPVRVFELLARKGALNQSQQDLRGHFEAGLTAYRAGDWDRAEAEFGQCVAIRPDDPPSKLFLTRVSHLRGHPPETDWDGVWTLSQK